MFLDKQEMIELHQGELEAWERLLSNLDTQQLIDPLLPSGWSVKDTLAHLGAWQSRTIARMEAFLQGHAPRLPDWPVELDEEETIEAVDRANAWILEAHRERPWADVYLGWRGGYLRFLELLKELPEREIRPNGKLTWISRYERMEDHPENYDYHHAYHRVMLEEAFGSNNQEYK